MRRPLLVLLLAGCSLGPELVPDTSAGAASVPGTPSAAMTELNGVRITVDGNAWQSEPMDLATALTPVQVTIENGSGAPLRVSLKDFSLVGSTGFHYAALPPLQAQRLPVGERDAMPWDLELAAATLPSAPIAAPMSPASHATAPTQVPSASPARAPIEHHDAAEREKPPHVTEPRFHAQSFYVAPRFGAMYPGFAAWPYFFPDDGTYYDRFYGEWPRKLPSEDMVNEALPEGVVDAGGSISGFVFFQRVSSRETRVQFAMKLVDAKTGQAIGDVTVPFAIAP